LKVDQLGSGVLVSRLIVASCRSVLLSFLLQDQLLDTLEGVLLAEDTLVDSGTTNHKNNREEKGSGKFASRNRLEIAPGAIRGFNKDDAVAQHTDPGQCLNGRRLDGGSKRPAVKVKSGSNCLGKQGGRRLKLMQGEKQTSSMR